MAEPFLEPMILALADRYRIERELGRGGMAVVLLAEDLRHRRRVALKVVLPEVSSETGSERFLREIATTAALRHRGIMPLFDSGSAGGLLFYVMPWIEGETLRHRLHREARLPVAFVLELATELSDALTHAHKAGVIHRDLKPENILLEQDHALLTDFGIAGALESPGGTGLTATGISLGTPRYMSPEQALGDPVDARSDLFSLGCVLYEALAGAPPFEGSTAAAVIQRIMTTPPRPLAEVRPDVPPLVSEAIQRALAREPDGRFGSVAEFAAALRAGATGAGDVGAHSPTRQGGSARRAWSRRRVLGVAALGLLIVVGAWFGISGRRTLGLVGAGGTGTTDSPEKGWVVVAEFDGPRSDPSLAVSARQLVMSGIDQSELFQAVPQDQLEIALNLAGKPDTTHVDAALARELAFRNGMKIVVEGRIDRIGSGFSVLVRARDADDGKLLLSLSEQARDEDDLIPLFGRLTQKLRKGLGERRNLLAPSELRWVAATPSFQAYRSYAAAFELQQMRGDDRGSLVLLREALRLDPDFAEAYALKMFAHRHLGEHDSAQVASQEALRRPERLTVEGRMFLEGLRQLGDGDIASADATYQELIRRGYQLSSSYGNRGGILWGAGRYAEALESGQRSIRASPFGPQQWVLAGEIDLLLMFGRLDEAREEAKGLQGWYVQRARLSLAVASGEWPRAESLAVAAADDPTLPQHVRDVAADVLFAAAVGRGALRQANSLQARQQEQALARADHDRARDVLLRTLLLHQASGGTPLELLPGSPADTTRRTRIARGLLAVATHDLATAHRISELLRHRGAAPSAGARTGEAVLEAWMVGENGDWRRAAGMLGPLARAGEQPDALLSPTWIRWTAAEAYRRAGQPDSAAALYELALSPEGLFWERRIEIRMLTPFAPRP